MSRKYLVLGGVALVAFLLGRRQQRRQIESSGRYVILEARGGDDRLTNADL